MNLSTFIQGPFNLKLYRRMGWEFAYIYINILGKLYFCLHPEEKSAIAVSLEATGIPVTGVSGRQQLRQVLNGISDHYFEKMFNAFSPMPALEHFFNICAKSVNMNTIKCALDKGRGLLLVTGHYGGVEYLPTYLAMHGFPVSGLIRFATPSLRRASVERAMAFDIRVIDIDRCPSVTGAVFECLGENRIVITQCDEVDAWRPSRYHCIRFLNTTVGLDRTINALARRAKPALAFGLMHRRTPFKYRLELMSMAEIADRMDAGGRLSSGEMMLGWLERRILQSPQQWYQWKKLSSLREDLQFHGVVETCREPVAVWHPAQPIQA